MPMTEAEQSVWDKRAEHLAEQVLHEIQDNADALITVDLLTVVLRIRANEVPESELDGYTFPGEEPEPECVCPPELLERGGHKGGCPVHGFVFDDQPR